MSNDDIAESISNLYETLPKKFKEEERHYENEKIINIKLPFQMCVTGATGSGKTNAVINIFKKINGFDKVMIWAKDTEEPIYASFIDELREVEKKTGRSILTVSNTITDLPEVASINKDNTTLLIIDDMVTEKDKALARVSEYWIRGRKKNVSCMFLSQSYFRIPKIIRDNSFYFIFSKISGERDLAMILKDYKLGVSDEQLLSLYNQATKEGFPNFFLIDIKTTDKGLRFRRNLKGMEPLSNLTDKEVVPENNDSTGGEIVEESSDVGFSESDEEGMGIGRKRRRKKKSKSETTEEKETTGKTKKTKKTKKRKTKRIAYNDIAVRRGLASQPKLTGLTDAQKAKKDAEDERARVMLERERLKAESKLELQKHREDAKMEKAYASMLARNAKIEAAEFKRMEKEAEQEEKRVQKEIEEREKERKRQYYAHPFNQTEKMEIERPEQIHSRNSYDDMDTGMGIGKKRKRPSSKATVRKNGKLRSLDSELMSLINKLH